MMHLIYFILCLVWQGITKSFLLVEGTIHQEDFSSSPTEVFSVESVSRVTPKSNDLIQVLREQHIKEADYIVTRIKSKNKSFLTDGIEPPLFNVQDNQGLSSSHFVKKMLRSLNIEDNETDVTNQDYPVKKNTDHKARKLQITCPTNQVFNSCCNGCGYIWPDSLASTTFLGKARTCASGTAQQILDCNNQYGLLNCWDTSRITSFANLFNSPGLTWVQGQSVNCWNTSKVTDFTNAFNNVKNVPADVAQWDVSQATIFNNMFSQSDFNQPISSWKMSKAERMNCMFEDSSFNQFIGNWDVSNVDRMNAMFSRAAFNQPIGLWNVSQVTDFSYMFLGNMYFNQPLNMWDTSKGNDFYYMFNFNGKSSVFNQPLFNWNFKKISSANSLGGMFYGASAFNQSLCKWYCTLPNYNYLSPPLQMFTYTNCTEKSGPDKATNASLCQSCNLPIDCTGTGTVNLEWAISQDGTLLQNLKYISSSVFTLTLNFKTGKHITNLKLYDDDCTTNITSSSPGSPLSVLTIPNITSIDSQTQLVSYSATGDLNSLMTSNLLISNTTDKVIIGFCPRLDLLDATGTSVSFYKNPLQITLNLTKMVNFSASNVSSSESAQGTNVSGNLGFDGSITACVCDSSTFTCYTSPPELGPFSFLSVCVLSLNSTVQIDKIVSSVITQSGTPATLQSIVNAIPSALTTITPSNDKLKTCIKTQLYSVFFEGVTAENKAQRKLSVQGSVQLKLANGARRLVKVSASNNFYVSSDLERNLREREEGGVANQLSTFKVNQISIKETSSDQNSTPSSKKLGIIIGTVLVALAVILVVLVVAMKKKQKYEYHHASV